MLNENRRQTKVINLRGVPEELVRRARSVAAYRGISLKQFVIDCLEECSKAEWDKIQKEIGHEEDVQQKARRFLDDLSRLPSRKK